MPDRRYKTLWVSDELVAGLFGQLLPGKADLSLRMLEGLPEGCTIDAVTHDWSRRAVGLRVHHPSFPEVPDGYCSDELFPLCCRAEVPRPVKGDDGVYRLPAPPRGRQWL